MMNKEKTKSTQETVIIAADLGLRRPAILIMSTAPKNKAEINRVFVIDNKSGKKDYKKSQPPILCEINKVFRESVLPEFIKIRAKTHPDLDTCPVAVRERGFSRFYAETQALFKVIGITDMALYELLNIEWIDIPPTTIKKVITGSGKASKEEVAKALNQYLVKPIEEYNFGGDDETDAVAVGLTWMLNNGYIRREIERKDGM